jgi:hypothetical protein
MPRLSNWFHFLSCVSTAVVPIIKLNQEGKSVCVGSFVLYFSHIDPLCPTCDETSEVLVFRKAQTTGQFLPLRPRDIRFAREAIRLYVP